ncbi:hypothetical protein BDQ17DRAFT_678131 [Cyathus striatus]|nr:hypothetical protein BDQ17DRAFT_678131 [Cyathus striatus]
MLPTERFINKRGSQLISSMFNNVFYGIAMCMVFQYFCNHAHRDNLNIKLVVYLLVISATLQVIFVNIQMFNVLVISFGRNMEVGGDIHFSVPGKYASIFLTAFIAQIFYATRIWAIGRNMGYTGRRSKLLAIPVVLLSSTQLGAGLAEVVLL